MTSDQIGWITHVDANGKANSLMRPMQIKLLIKPACPRLSPLLLRSETATHSPSQTGHKIKKFMFLMQRLPPHARLVTPAKSWPSCLTLRKPILHGALNPPAPERLTTMDLWPSLRPIGRASMLLTLFQVTLLLFQSDQLNPNKLLWPWKLT